MIIHQIPSFIPKIFPKLIWEKPDNDPNIKTIYLTFDDGPSPDITNFVLAELKKYDAKATFFVIGDKVNRYPETFELVIKEGHSIGNHTFNHLNAWKYPALTYEENFYKCESEIEKFGVKSIGFRPPYGRINRYIYQHLIHHTPIVMWSQLTGDYDKNLNPSKAFESISPTLKSGDIIVLHDSEKSSKNLSVLLPKLLSFGKENGFQFKSL